MMRELQSPDNGTAGIPFQKIRSDNLPYRAQLSHALRCQSQNFLQQSKKASPEIAPLLRDEAARLESEAGRV